MRIDLCGITRTVFIFKTVVVKVPNIRYGWLKFLNGLISNINENSCWKWHSGQCEDGKSHLLCPVLWCSWGGWLLVMKRVDRVLTDIEYNSIDLTKHIEYFSGDDKSDNYGHLYGKVVKIDYGS